MLIDFKLDNFEELEDLCVEEWGDHELKGGTLFKRKGLEHYQMYQTPPIWADSSMKHWNVAFLGVLGIEMFTDKCTCPVKKGSKCPIELILRVWNN